MVNDTVKKHQTEEMEFKRAELKSLLERCEVLAENIIIKVNHTNHKGITKEYFDSLKNKMINVSDMGDCPVYKSISDLLSDLIYAADSSMEFISPWSD